MPLHQTAQDDPLTRLIRFRTSALFETVGSLQAVAHPWYHREWTARTRDAMGNAFVEEVVDLYGQFHMGCDFAEMAIEYADQHDVPGFLEYVESLPLQSFAYYVLGRLYPLDEIPAVLSAAGIERMVERHGNTDHLQHSGADFAWADDADALKRRVTGLWRRYWEEFFHRELAGCEPFWEASIREKEEILYGQGGVALLDHVTGYQELPPQLPEGQPYTQVQFIPVYRTPRRHHTYYGYGIVTVVYDCRRTERLTVEVEQTRTRALSVMRALSDEKRLLILRLIADEVHRFNGKRISEKIGISPSVVSRHLSQLKDAGLISERSVDNRNITYRLNRRAVEQLSDILLNFLNV